MSIPPPQSEVLPIDGTVPALPPAGDRAPCWGLWMAPAAIVLGLGLGQIFVIAVNIIGQAIGGSTLQHPSPAVSLISDGLADLAFVAAAVFFVSRAARLQAADFGFVRTPLGRAAASVAGAAAAYYLITLVYASLLGLHGKDKLPSELGVSHSTAALVGAAVFVCVVAPIAEEFFFRGFLLRVLSGIPFHVGGRDAAPWLAAVIVSILFGLAHTGSASSQYLIPLGFLGFILCGLRIRTGSLYPCMALHSLNNSLALGVNSLHWSGVAILALISGSLAVIAALVGPLSAGRASAPVLE